MPLPQLRLSVEDQCRLRDRSTIMARQMYATQGNDFADAQVSLAEHLKSACHSGYNLLEMLSPVCTGS